MHRLVICERLLSLLLAVLRCLHACFLRAAYTCSLARSYQHMQARLVWSLRLLLSTSPGWTFRRSNGHASSSLPPGWLALGPSSPSPITNLVLGIGPGVCHLSWNLSSPVSFFYFFCDLLRQLPLHTFAFLVYIFLLFSDHSFIFFFPYIFLHHSLATIYEIVYQRAIDSHRIVFVAIFYYALTLILIIIIFNISFCASSSHQPSPFL